MIYINVLQNYPIFASSISMDTDAASQILLGLVGLNLNQVLVKCQRQTISIERDLSTDIQILYNISYHTNIGIKYL
jgi:hypothetical protein